MSEQNLGQILEDTSIFPDAKSRANLIYRVIEAGHCGPRSQDRDNKKARQSLTPAHLLDAFDYFTSDDYSPKEGDPDVSQALSEIVEFECVERIKASDQKHEIDPGFSRKSDYHELKELVQKGARILDDLGVEARKQENAEFQANMSTSRAAKLYELAGDRVSIADAARCYERVEHWQKAAEMYERGDSFEQASLCYEKVGDLRKAALTATKYDADRAVALAARTKDTAFKVNIATECNRYDQALSFCPEDDYDLRIRVAQHFADHEQVVTFMVEAGKTLEAARYAKEHDLERTEVLYQTVIQSHMNRKEYDEAAEVASEAGWHEREANIMLEKGDKAMAAVIFEQYGMKEKASPLRTELLQESLRNGDYRTAADSAGHLGDRRVQELKYLADLLRK